ncbi:AMP-binding protein [Streptomyces sp. NPDC050619]|uniref:(2,3-dihydroxybenzoyl)adenylate synthase n=1 Tax=Streptomyces sp. NPDC050619 TaxID=3157214 RepID=UPI0034467D4B
MTERTSPEELTADQSSASAIGVPPWPADFAARYRAAGYWRDEPLGSWMWRRAEEHGDRTALVDGDRRITYRAMAEHADALAEALLVQGLDRGDRVLVQLPNCWELVLLVLACARTGIAPVLALVPHREHELDYLARHAEARMIVVPDRWRAFDHQAMAARLAEQLGRPLPVAVVGDHPHPGHLDLRHMLRVTGDVSARRRRIDGTAPAAEDIALFVLSGGTTGQPKMIGRTHNDYTYAARRMGEIIHVGPETTYLVTLPAAHNFPLGGPGIVGTLAVGGRVVMLPSPEPHAAFTMIERESPTVTSLVPAIARRWVEAAEATWRDLSSLEVVQVGGSPLDPALARRIQATLGCRLQQVFGMAEGLLNCTRLDDDDDVVFGTQGRPISPGDELLIVDDDGVAVPPGAVGELLTRGPYTPRGYYRSPEHNRRTFTTDGWYRTGDLVRTHPSGNLVVEGRNKDLINRGGEKISAEEVESLARAMLTVRDAVTVPVPDAHLGERVCLVVVPAEGQPPPTLESVRDAFTAHGVAHYKVPEQVEVLDAIPLTPIGKPHKQAIRSLISARPR